MNNKKARRIFCHSRESGNPVRARHAVPLPCQARNDTFTLLGHFIFFWLMPLAFCLLMTGCGGGSNPVSNLNQATTPLLAPASVSASGSVNISFNQNVSTSQFKMSSLQDSQGVSLSTDNQFTLKVNPEAVQFVRLVDANSKPVAFAVTQPGTDYTKTPLQLNAATTATSLIYLVSLLSGADDAKAKEILSYISTLQEVTQIAALLEANIKDGKELLTSLNTDAKNLIKTAVQKIMQNFSFIITATSVSAKQKAVITAPSDANRISVAIVDDTDQSKVKVKFSNSERRHLSAKMINNNLQDLGMVDIGPGKYGSNAIGTLFDKAIKPDIQVELNFTNASWIRVDFIGIGFQKDIAPPVDVTYLSSISRSMNSLCMAPVGIILGAFYGQVKAAEAMAKYGLPIAEKSYNIINEFAQLPEIKELVEAEKYDEVVKKLVWKLITSETFWTEVFKLLGHSAAEAAKLAKDIGAAEAGVFLDAVLATVEIPTTLWEWSQLAQLTRFTIDWKTVTSALSASINADTTSGVAPLAVSFTATVSGGDISCGSTPYTYSWNFADGSTSTLSNPSHTFTTVASYEVSLTVTDCAGSKATATKIITVTSAVNQSPTATLSADKTSGTAPLTVTFTIGYTDPEGAGGTYSLDYGDSSGTVTGQLNSGATTTVQHTYSSAGTFTAALTVTDDKSATGTGSVTITVAASGGGTKTAQKVSAGYYHTCALLSDGTVKCWGNNQAGQLGNGTTTSFTTPVLVSGITNAINISAGYYHTCAVLSDGSIKCWGSDGSGQLGNGTAPDSNTPVSVSGINNAINVSAGGDHTCAVLSDGTIKCWGNNISGRLGDGTSYGHETCVSFLTYDCSTTPVSVTGITNAISVSAGYNHTCALLSDGTIKCWGANYYGQLGMGSTIGVPTPVFSVSSISSAVSVSVGSGHTCALLSDGSVKCWGANNFGQLGIEASSTPGTCVDFTICSTTPVSVINNAINVSAGGWSAQGNVSGHTCAVLSDGSVRCWGRNSSGQLGNGTTTSFNSPVSVSGITNATNLAAGSQHTCAILSDGTVKCWGLNNAGQLGNGTLTEPETCPIGYGCSTTPVSVSDALYALSPWTQFKNLACLCGRAARRQVLSFADTIKRTFGDSL